jgi:hypothetical protein
LHLQCKLQGRQGGRASGRSFKRRRKRNPLTNSEIVIPRADRQIWDEAVSRSAVLVTKDRDFALRRTASNDGPTPAIIDAIERDEAVIEFAGR